MPKWDQMTEEHLTLSKNGIWFANGSEITHRPTHRLFSKSIRQEPDGYWIQIGRERKKVEVEDTAFFVERITGSPSQGYQLQLSDQTQESLVPETLTYRPGRLACRIKDGGEEARFLTIAYLDLLKELREDQDAYYLDIQGCRFDLERKICR